MLIEFYFRRKGLLIFRIIRFNTYKTSERRIIFINRVVACALSIILAIILLIIVIPTIRLIR